MKKALLFATAFLAAAANAQIVDIPDPAFKNALLNHSPVIDTNGDGQIQISEAQALTELEVGTVGNLGGIEAFLSLTSIKATLSNQESLDLSMLSQLEHLEIPKLLQGNPMTSLNVSGLHLKYVDVMYHFLDEIDLDASANTIETLIARENNLGTNGNLFFDCTMFTNLKYLDMRYNPFPLIVTGLTQLEYLDCIGTSTSSLSINTATNLKTLLCANNQLTVLDVGPLTNLEILECGENPLTSLAVGNLTSLKYLNCTNNQLTQLDVANLVNLESLYCAYNQIASLSLGNLSNLKMLSCGLCGLTELDVSNNTALTDLSFGSNLLTTVDLQMLTQLISLDCSYNNLTHIDVAQSPGLTSLQCQGNQLTNLDISTLSELSSLHCAGNQLTTLDLSNAHSLYNFGGADNLFTELDFSACTQPNSVQYNFTANPNLTYVNMKNGAQPYVMSTSNGLQCPNLVYICTDEAYIQPLKQSLQSTDPNIQVSSYCSFTPGGNYNTISGTITFDADNNGCGSPDPVFGGTKVKIVNGSSNGATFTDDSGNYFFMTGAGNFTITPISENSHFTFSPTSTVVSFASADQSAQTADFCATANGVHKDLEVTILPLEPARPGFNAAYRIVYKNKGNQIQAGNIHFTYDNALLEIITTLPPASSQSGNAIDWNFSDLLPTETRTIDLTLNVNSPLDTPPVNIDDELNFLAVINPQNDDETPSDNSDGLKQSVVGSFDPNDKTCLEGNYITPEMVGDYLHYVIRFQNSGTFYAENVVVKDVINTSKFDLSTFQLTASSHPQVTRITGNKVEFIFEGINLPAEQDDEPGSHGFVAFKIKTKPTLVLNEVVQNKADIFFDFNAPIVTNTALTTVSLLGLNEVSNVNVSIAPNPVKNVLDISSRDNLTSAQVFDIQGRLLQTTLENGTQSSIDFSHRTQGVYFVKVTTEKGVQVEKIIKQ